MKKRARQGKVTLYESPHYTPAEKPQTPTPERIAKGSYTVGTGSRVYRDEHATSLHRALANRAITPEQYDAGARFLAMRTAAIRIRAGSGQRDSLDMTPRGMSEASPEYEARILADDAEVARRLGPELRGAAEKFVVDDQSLGRFDLRYLWWQTVVEALSALEDWYSRGRR